jgi:PAS domain S-box-containing protein
MKNGIITKYLEVGENSKRSKNIFDCILNGQNEGVVLVDPNFVIKDINKSILTQYRITRDEIVGQYCYEFTRNHGKPCLRRTNSCPLLEVLHTNKPVRVFSHPRDKYVQPMDGAHKTTKAKIKPKMNAELFAFPIFGDDGEINYMVELTKRSNKFEQQKKPMHLLRDIIEPDRELLTRNQLSYILLTAKDNKLFEKILQVLLKALKSNYGVIGYLDSDGVLVCPAMTQDIWDLYKKSDRIPANYWKGYWGRTLKEGKSFLSNKSFLPPKRHIPIKNAMVVPIHDNQKDLFGLIIIGDRDSNYDNTDRAFLQNMANYLAPNLQAWMLEHPETIVNFELESNQESESDYKKYWTIFNNAANLITSINDHGIIIECNNRIFDLLGYSRDEAIGESILKMLHPDYHSKAQSEWKTAKDDCFSFNNEYKMIHKDGSTIDVSVNISNNNKDDSGESQSVWVIEDSTKRKEVEDKLRQDCDRAEVYLDILGHDINNINQAITTYSELLLLKPDISDQYKKYIQTTLNQSHSISDLITNVRKLSRLKKGRMERTNIDVLNALAKASDQVQIMNPDKSIKINQSISGNEVVVTSNELLTDLFLNILSNAVKFDTNSEVLVDISHSKTDDGNFWKLEIKDHGPGITDDLKTRVFGGFDIGSAKTRGSGLGLMVVKEIAGYSGGRVWVEDRVPGDHTLGSNFVVLLPVACN